MRKALCNRQIGDGHRRGEAKVFGYEVDSCDYAFRNGLPYPTCSGGAPENLEILAMGLASTFEADHGNPGSAFFIADFDAQAIANHRFRRTDEATVDSVRRGSGMIACFVRGQGSVFNAATYEWVAGLIPNDPFVEQITINVLERFTGRVSGNWSKAPHRKRSLRPIPTEYGPAIPIYNRFIRLGVFDKIFAALPAMSWKQDQLTSMPPI